MDIRSFFKAKPPPATTPLPAKEAPRPEATPEHASFPVTTKECRLAEASPPTALPLLAATHSKPTTVTPSAVKEHPGAPLPTTNLVTVTVPATALPKASTALLQSRKRPAAAAAAIPSGAELKRAKKIVAAAAKVKKAEKEDAFTCPPELLEWAKVRML